MTGGGLELPNTSPSRNGPGSTIASGLIRDYMVKVINNYNAIRLSLTHFCVPS